MANSKNTGADINPSLSDAKDKIKTKKIKRKFPLDTMVEVKNGFNGKLIYVSKKNAGYTVIMDRFGDSEYFELGELISARNSAKKFFENNWFLIDDIEIIKFLGVEKYYENALGLEEFDSIFKRSNDEIVDAIGKLSAGQRNTLIFRAIELIEDGTIDSRKTINALEDALKVELIEK